MTLNYDCLYEISKYINDNKEYINFCLEFNLKFIPKKLTDLEIIEVYGYIKNTYTNVFLERLLNFNEVYSLYIQNKINLEFNFFKRFKYINWLKVIENSNSYDYKKNINNSQQNSRLIKILNLYRNDTIEKIHKCNNIFHYPFYKSFEIKDLLFKILCEENIMENKKIKFNFETVLKYFKKDIKSTLISFSIFLKNIKIYNRYNVTSLLTKSFMIKFIEYFKKYLEFYRIKLVWLDSDMSIFLKYNKILHFYKLDLDYLVNNFKNDIISNNTNLSYKTIYYGILFG